MGGKVSHVNVVQIEHEIKKAPVVVYTKQDCSYCKKAKELLDLERLRYKEYSLDLIPKDKFEDYKNGLIYITRQTTVPQVFICGKFIGGFTELYNLKEQKKLHELVDLCRDW